MQQKQQILPQILSPIQPSFHISKQNLNKHSTIQYNTTQYNIIFDSILKTQIKKMIAQKILTFYQAIRYRNYKIAYNGSIGLSFATFLYFIRQLQILSLLYTSREYAMDVDVLAGNELVRSLFVGLKVSVLQFSGLDQISQVYIYLGILLIQIVQILCWTMPTTNKSFLRISSKLLTISNILLPIPITLHLTHIQNMPGTIIKKQLILTIGIISFILMLINLTMYTNFHFVFSIKNITTNSLTRFPHFWAKDFGWVTIAFCYAFLVKFGSFNLFVVYILGYLAFACFQAKVYAIEVEFFDSKMNRNLGIFTLLTITFAIAIFSCFIQFTLFRNSLTAFICAFYLFFVNFFLTFRKFWLKRIIIDDNTTTQASQITYVTTFIIFSIDSSQKKNQTYISSLLKNHCNNCNKVECCCKNRDTIYDPATKHRGMKQVQPHLDPVFVKHFYNKMIEDSIEQFPKSIDLKMLHGIYCKQFLHLSPQCIRLIKIFNKKFIFDKLSVQQKYVLFCLEQEFLDFVNSHNNKYGNKHIEKVKVFDQYFNQLISKIMIVTQNLNLFWQSINSQSKDQTNKQLDPEFLNLISTKTIKQMQQIESIYLKMKQINPSSSQLRDIMFFYSKEVINDMEMFIRLKEDLKIQSISRRQISDKKQQKNMLNIYSSESSNMVIANINQIVWISNNSQNIFGYKKLSTLQKVPINNLMPPFFGKGHDLLVKKWLQTGCCKKMNSTNVIWCIRQNGSCFRALIYMKLMVNFQNPIEKDIHYYTSIETIDSNDIVCGQDGEIYACDESCRYLMKTPMKILQNLRPNIQIFFPYLFQHFFPYFYNDQPQPQLKQKQEQRYSGYIPGKIIEYLHNLSKQKQNMIAKNKKNAGYKKIYGNFLQMKMQQITINIKGRYITVDLEVEKIKMFERNLIVVKIRSLENNTVQRYFNQFQRSLKQIQMLKDKLEMKKQSGDGITRKLDRTGQLKPLQLFLNPRRLKKLHQATQPQHKISRHPIPNSMTHRKQRAINQLIIIENERVKKTIQKIKQCLLQNKILSPNVYRILTQNYNKDDQYIVQEQQQDDDDDNHIQKTVVFGKARSRINVVDEDIGSNDELLEDGDGSLDKYIDKDKDAVSFQQSTASSAAYISLSTKIKLLKQKLKQITAHPFLQVLHYLCLTLLLSTILMNLSQIYISHTNTYIKQKQNKQLLSTYRLFDSLMATKLIINHYNIFNNNNNNNDMMLKQLNQLYLMFRNITYQEYEKNFKNGDYMQQFQIDGVYPGGSWFSIADFVGRQYFQVLAVRTSWKANLYQRIFSKIHDKVQTNSQAIYQPSIILYLLGGYLVVKLLTLLNLWLAKKKIQQITRLISQLYPHQKQKYQKQYMRLQSKTACLLEQKNILQPQSQQKKHEKHEKQANQSKQPISISIQTQTQAQAQAQAQHKHNEYKRICIYIWFSFLLVYAAVLAIFFVQSYYYRVVVSKQSQIDRIVVSKLEIGARLLWLQGVRGGENRVGGFNGTVGIVPDLVNLYNQHNTDKRIKEAINKYSNSNSNICLLLPTPTLHQSCQTTLPQASQTSILNSYSYIQQQLKYYSYRDVSGWVYKQMKQTLEIHLFSTILTFQLFEYFVTSKNQLQYFIFYLKVGLFGCLAVVVGVFGVVWRVVFRGIARLGSLHNRCLLIIPFDLLIQNPYLRQYLKEELMFKNNIY